MGDMIQSSRNIAVDLYNPRAVQVYAKQGDRMSRFINVSIYDNGSFVFLDKSKITAIIKYIKPSGEFGIDSCKINDDGKVIIALTDNFTNYSGRINAEISLVELLREDNNYQSVITTMQFCVNILPSTFKPEDVYNTTEFNAFYDLMSKFLDDYSDIMEAASGLITFVKSVNGVYADENKNISIGYPDIGLVKTEDLDDAIITIEKMADNAISTAKILNFAITEDKIDNGSVTTDKLSDGSVTTDKLSDGSVTTEKLLDSSVTTSKLFDGSVTTDKLSDGSVTNEKIQDSTITGSKLVDKTITRDKVSDVFLTDNDKNGIDKIGVQSRDMNIGGNKVVNVGVPTDNTDAANKQYVDNKDAIYANVTMPDSTGAWNWYAAGGFWFVDVNLAGLSADDHVIIGLDYDHIDVSKRADAKDAWGEVLSVRVNNGSVSFAAPDKPSMALPCIARIERAGVLWALQ